MTVYDIIIAGAGPAGLTAALYARRAGKTVLLIEKESFGGQIVLSPLVENYPFTKPLSGTELVDSLVNAVLSLGAEICVDTVTGVTKNEDGSLLVKTEYDSFTARSLIIATGLKHRRLGLEGEASFIGKGISFCAVCDGAFFKGKTVAVIGGGNTAVQDAIYLSKLCKKVYLIHRRDRFRAEKKVVDGLDTCTNVELIMNSKVVKLYGSDKIESITVESTVDGSMQVLNVEGIFAAVGQEPNNAAFSELVDLDDAGFVICIKILSDTSVKYSGKASELASVFNMSETIFAGFLDGINTSLVTSIDVESVEPDTEIVLDIDFEKLYFNMHEAKADWLYNLKEWDSVLSEEKRKAIVKEFRLSKQFINNSPKVGPNDPCPCGSGKKYRKCCGRLAD